MSAGICPSTSRCHSTSCHRSGSEANARAAAPLSKPATAVSWNSSPASYAAMSSVGRVRASDRTRSMCRRRRAVSR